MIYIKKSAYLWLAISFFFAFKSILSMEDRPVRKIPKRVTTRGLLQKQVKTLKQYALEEFIKNIPTTRNLGALFKAVPEFLTDQICEWARQQSYVALPYLRDRWGNTFLRYATQYYPEGISALIDAGDDPNMQDKEGKTPLMLAVESYTASIQNLLNKRARPTIQDKHGNTALHSAAYSNPQAFIPLMKAGADINLRNLNGWTPLMIAVQYNPEIVPRMLEYGADPTLASQDQVTPLRLALIHKRHEAFWHLLNAGVHINDIHEISDSFKIIVLRHAALRYPASLPNLFATLNDYDAQDDTGTTALHIAAQFCPQALQMLLQKGANPNKHKHKNLLTPLMLAILYHPELVPLLLYYGANPNAQNKEGTTALMFAIRLRNRSVMQTLLEYGADPNVEDNLGNSSLMIANRSNPEFLSLFSSEK